MKKKILYFVMVIGMLLVLPFSVTNAAEPNKKEDYARIQINGATTLEDATNVSSITATFEHGSVTFAGIGLYSDGNNQIYVKGDVTVTATPSSSYTADLWVDGTDLKAATTNFAGLNGNDFKNMDALFDAINSNSNQKPNVGPNNGNTKANVVVSAGTGTYKISRHGQVTEENYDDMVEFYINGSMWDPSSATINYDDKGTDKVTFTFETLWINRYYDNIVINGTSYKVSDYLDFDDRTSWLVANHGTQLISFDIPNVPKADTYNIVVKHGENNGTRYFATFLWTADPNQASGHNYIGHSKLEFVKAVYEVGGKTYTVTEADLKGKLMRDGQFDSYTSTDGFFNYGVLNNVNFDDGSLTLPGGAQVTMRVVPEYGYQVTSVNGGGKFTTTDAGVSEFTIVVPEGTAGYFQAEVTKVDDEVKANSQKVSSGIVAIAAGEIDAGTVRLSVDDVELSSDKIKNFEKAAGSYSISHYLDINLNKVLYKGSDDDVWEEQIHHLKKEATITLKLEDGVNASDIVIVHNIDDGEEFEVIEIESYNPETNEITFKTKSFSNYAIATKTEVKKDSKKNPKTGDNYTMLTFVLGISIIGLLVGSLYLIKRKNKNN